MSALNPRRGANPLHAFTRAYRFFKILFFDPALVARRLVQIPDYLSNARRYSQLQDPSERALRLQLRNLKPMLGERGQAAGDASGHYFHQDIWAARHIHARHPVQHVDIGSSVAGFVAHLLCFREVEFVDIRPLRTNVPGLRYVSGDLLDLPYADESLESVSSLHVVEHVGLGRYGDEIAPNGWRRACQQLDRVLKPGGTLYFSVPIGDERIEFDAHRVFDPMTIVRIFDTLDLLEFAHVDDAGDYVSASDPRLFEGHLCCGLFLFMKPK